MLTYIVRRLLLMVPTLFAISCIVFVILNLAPGMPGELASATGEEAADESGSKREAYRIFKHQFNLDKPIMLNFRYRLEQEDIMPLVRTIARQGADSSLKAIIRAEERLEDYGHYAVPHLVTIVRENGNAALSHVAARKFSENARGRQFRDYRHISGIQARELAREYAESYPDSPQGDQAFQQELVSYVNKNVAEQNAYIRSLWYRKDAAPERRQAVHAAIGQWFETHRHWYAYSFWDKVRITLLDTRFARYWWNLLHLDFGISHVDKIPVLHKVLRRLKYSITLSLTALLLAYIISVPLGVWSAYKQNSWSDRLISLVLFMLYSLPTFFVGTLLLMLFSQGGNYWHVFPTGGFQSLDHQQLTTWAQFKDILWHIMLPIFCLTYAGLAALSRYARSGILDVIRSDYIKTARAKGLPEHLVIVRHAVRNGMIPVLTLLGTMLPIVIGGSVVIEYIFAIDGMGLLMLGAITARDYNTIMCITLISAVLTMLGILLSDISYALVDPRISFN